MEPEKSNKDNATPEQQRNVIQDWAGQDPNGICINHAVDCMWCDV